MQNITSIQISTFTIGLIPVLRLAAGYFNAGVIFVYFDEPAFNPVQDAAGRPHERSLYVLLGQGRSLQVDHVEISGQLQSLVAGNHALLGQVDFISNQDQKHVLIAVVANIFDPPRHAAEGLFASGVEDD